MKHSAEISAGFIGRQNTLLAARNRQHPLSRSLDVVIPEERDRLLDSLCVGDDELRRRVEALLAEASVQQAIRAREAEQLAESRLQESEANLQRAPETVDKYFTTVSESQLLNVPGLQPLRSELLESALGFYERYTESAADDPAVQIKRIATCFRVCQARFQARRYDEAMKSLDQAVELLERWLSSREISRLGTAVCGGTTELESRLERLERHVARAIAF